MKELLNIKRFRFYFWTGIAYLFIWIIYAGANHPDEFYPRIANEVWRAIYITVLNYFLYEYIGPRLSRKHVLRSIGFFVLALFLLITGLYLWRGIGIGLGIHTVFVASGSHASSTLSYQFSSSLSSVLFYGVVKHIYDHILLRQAAQQLRIEKQEAELNYLKSQTNPHFLFNTLNNIYSLAKDKSDLAPESILRLSKILRYMLYETSGEYVAIDQEIRVMNDYIALEKLRYDESLTVNFNHDIEDMRQALPPLLLIPLVENAFKHGVAETRNRPFLDIHLSVNKRQLLFVVKNSTDLAMEEKVVKESIGLSNLRRQLELLYRDYDLSVKQGASDFSATLKINLGSHV